MSKNIYGQRSRWHNPVMKGEQAEQSRVHNKGKVKTQVNNRMMIKVLQRKCDVNCEKVT